MVDLAVVSAVKLPEIHVGSDIVRMSDAAIEALVDDTETYQRGGQLVHVARALGGVGAVHRMKRAAGSPTIRPMTTATLAARMSTAVRWLTRKRDSFVQTTPPAAVVAAVLDRGAWKDIKTLVGVSESPYMRDDGTVCQKDGFDDASGYLYIPNARYPEVPEHPNQGDAQDAWRELTGAFGLFPFSNDHGLAAVMSAVLTLLARSAIEGAVPGIVLDATTPGSGKTLLADAISVIATGRPAARTTWPDEEGEELRKVLDGYAITGERFISVDNVDGALRGSALDAYLTAQDLVSVRELGRTGQLQVPWRGMLSFSGNNVDIRGDTRRRVLHVRLVPNCEKPEERQGLPNLLHVLHLTRPSLITGALTILRAYTAARYPNLSTRSWGSFEGWARLIPPAIKYASGLDPMDAQVTDDDHGGGDPGIRALTAILLALPQMDPKGMTTRQIVHLLYPGGRPPGREAPPDGFEAVREAVEVLAPPRSGGVPATSTLGYRLRHYRGRIVDGKRLVADTAHAGVMRWKAEPVE